MRCLTVVIASCLTVSSCAWYSKWYAEREASVEEEDKAWCAKLGIHPGDAQYADCRLAATQERKPLPLLLPAPPLSSPLLCSLYGNRKACEWLGQQSLGRD